jgi:hypothetical protein
MIIGITANNFLSFKCREKLGEDLNRYLSKKKLKKLKKTKISIFI